MTGESSFTGVWWNAYYPAQQLADGSNPSAAHVAEMTDELRPDWWCLQEVLAHNGQTRIADTLEEDYGYSTAFLANFPLAQGVEVGYLLAVRDVSRLQSDIGARSIGNGRDASWSQLQRVRLNLGSEADPVIFEIGNVHGPNWRWDQHHFLPRRRMRIGLQGLLGGSILNGYAVGGDNNFDIRDPRLRQLRDTHDVCTGTNDDRTWRHKGWLPLALNLDAVFVSQGGRVRVADSRLGDNGPSDHKPIIINFAVDAPLTT